MSKIIKKLFIVVSGWILLSTALTFCLDQPISPAQSKSLPEYFDVSVREKQGLLSPEGIAASMVSPIVGAMLPALINTRDFAVFGKVRNNGASGDVALIVTVKQSTGDPIVKSEKFFIATGEIREFEMYFPGSEYDGLDMCTIVVEPAPVP